jgi:hypothetical protein
MLAISVEVMNNIQNMMAPRQTHWNLLMGKTRMKKRRIATLVRLMAGM